jgi:ATP-dependent Lhr-like helicase
MRQLYGIAGRAGAWERDYLRVRVSGYDPAWLTQFASSGEAVWAGESTPDSKSDVTILARLRFFERGTGSLWLFPEEPEKERKNELTEQAGIVRGVIERDGASFTSELEMATGLTALAVKEALRELVAAGDVTNDTVDALREIIRWRPLGPRNSLDAARWLPRDFSPSANRQIVHRRPNVRRLPKWKRPDRPGAPTGAWPGRWSLVRRGGNLGPVPSDEDHARRIAHYWLHRYGVVSRECWRRERPPVHWRSIYRELKRMEFRGEVRRGYFVQGLGGAQFVLPQAVELLREALDAWVPAVVGLYPQDPPAVPRAGLAVTRRPVSQAAYLLAAGRACGRADATGEGEQVEPNDAASARRTAAAEAAVVRELVRALLAVPTPPEDRERLEREVREPLREYGRVAQVLDGLAAGGADADALFRELVAADDDAGRVAGGLGDYGSRTCALYLGS